MCFIKKPLLILCILALYSCNATSSENAQLKSDNRVLNSDKSSYSSSDKSVSSDYSPEMTSAERIRQAYAGSGYSSGRNLQRSSSVLDQAHSQAAARIEAVTSESCNDDLTCLMMASNDRLGLEAIRSLHRQLDDDANGAVDLTESNEFLREELQYEDGAEKRQRAFHRNDDMHISVKELWDAWLRSEVHNWTVEQTTEWLATNVELPQYVPVFIVNKVTGATLPRLAVSNMQYLSNVLGIKDPIHKQKIALKAMDVVLFGPPKDTTHHLKDLILVTLLLGALIGCWYAYRQNKNSRKHLRRMMKDMESLHKAEVALETLQKELERARQEQEYATTEKQDLERRLQQQHSGESELRTSYSDLEVSQLKAEIEMLRTELQRAEGELEDRCWSPPVGLQQWLQLTHEIENKAYVKKKLSAEKQLQQAREACEKLRKKRSSLVGAFVSTHGKTIDDVDRSIVEARTALNEVTQELAERVHRWKQIEMMCGFNIINNSGLAVLESVLYRNTANGRGIGLRGRMSSSQDDLDDDASSCSPSTGFESGLGTWREHEAADSSESEKLDVDDEDSKSNVHFTVGGSEQDDCTMTPKNVQQIHQPQQFQHQVHHRSGGGGSYGGGDYFNKNTRMSRSYSQDIHPEPTHDYEPPLPKMSQSETNLDVHNQVGQSSNSATSATPRPRKILSRSRMESPQSTVDEETYSTDSNSVVEESITVDTKVSSKSKKFPFMKFRKSKSTSQAPQQQHLSSHHHSTISSKPT